MLYYLFDWLQGHNFPGAGMFQYISFRAALSIVLSLFISLIIGRSVIKKLKEAQIGETIRNLGLEGQLQKKGTPTMGGLIIIASIIIPVLLVNKLDNIYIILMIFTTLWLGCLGFADDYIKVFKKNKEGLSKRKKLIGQIVLGLIVGIVMCFHPDVVIKEKSSVGNKQIETTEVINNDIDNHNTSVFSRIPAQHNSTKTTIPFVKNNEFDYAWLTNWTGDKSGLLSSLVYILVVIFIIAAVSNGANLTDGLDGLAISTAAIICIGIAILAYVSGNSIFADYLNIMYIPNIGELVVFIAALLGACLGFYWWNCFPAQVFMGDTGSLSLGGIIAVLCIIIRKELLIPVLCGIYLIESVSVIIQTSYFKYTKKKTGEGKRIFLMAPIHHHFQKKGMHETKIVQRFIIIGILLAVISVVTLKVR